MSGNSTVCIHGRKAGEHCTSCKAVAIAQKEVTVTPRCVHGVYMGHDCPDCKLFAAGLGFSTASPHNLPCLKAWQDEEGTMRNNSTRYQYLREMATRPEMLELLELNPDQWDAFIDSKLIQEGVRHK